MSFTEIKAEELKDNPFDLIGKQWMLITAGNEEKCNTMTASSYLACLRNDIGNVIT